MNKPYFIMMYAQQEEHAVPLIEEDENVAFYETYREAYEIAENHPYAKALGYEIFCMGEGI